MGEISDAYGALAQLRAELERQQSEDADFSLDEPATWHWLPRSITRWGSKNEGPTSEHPYLLLALDTVGMCTIYPRTTKEHETRAHYFVEHGRHQHWDEQMRRCGLNRDAQVLTGRPVAIPAYHFRDRRGACTEDDRRWLAQVYHALETLCRPA